MKQNKRKGNILVRKEPRNTFNPVEEFTQQQNPSVKLLRCVLCAVCTSAIRWCVCVCAHQKRPMEAGKLQTKCAVYTVVFVRDSSSSSFFYTMADLVWGNGEKGGKKGTEIGFETRRNKTTVVFSWKKRMAVLTKRALSQMYILYSPRCGDFFDLEMRLTLRTKAQTLFFFVCFLLVLR